MNSGLKSGLESGLDTGLDVDVYSCLGVGVGSGLHL